MLSSYWLLDFFVVLYFRCININYIRRNESQISQFVDEGTNFQEIIDGIARYGNDAEGVVIEVMTLATKSDIHVILVREDRENSFTLNS
mgnify:CR=1 FL=1